ncbi:MAG: MBL fold metallo-hydrolase [Eubacteriales bacterium]|nr:MBL fold metallo-hydrolase [Eubacteriales bacterium]
MKQNFPIKNELKAKRIKWGAPQNYISWAYMKELRENNKTRKIYEIDPYVEVYQFRDNLYGLFTQNCDGAGDVWMFLIVGPRKAMLIDTAFGLGDLKGLCDEITGGKELVVVNTHGHVDHSYGNCRFEKVYCQEYEVPNLREQNAHMFDYLFDENGNNIWLEFEKEDLPVYREYEIVGVPDGYVFDLGDGYEVELFWLGGHAPGNSGFLDKQNRIFFPGDDLCSDVSGVGNGPRPGVHNAQYMNIETFRNNLARVVDRMDEIDYVFPSHFMVNVESGVLIEELKACDEILKDPDRYDYRAVSVSPKGGEPSERFFKYIRGFSVLAYKMEGVYQPKK